MLSILVGHFIFAWIKSNWSRQTTAACTRRWPLLRKAGIKYRYSMRCSPRSLMTTSACSALPTATGALL